MSTSNTLVPAAALARITRRGFCQAAAVGVVTIALPACFGDGMQRVSGGGLDTNGNPQGPGPDGGSGGAGDLAHSGGQQPDLAQNTGPVDMAHGSQPQPDLTQQTNPNACPGGVFGTSRPPAMFALNTATYFSSQDLFVCRDANGLFAITSLCSHAGCTISFRTSSDSFHCPCHGAAFNLDGDSTNGFAPLDHYAVCIASDGSVSVDVNTTVSASTRLNA
jgi:Rieske Fe-S protein